MDKTRIDDCKRLNYVHLFLTTPRKVDLIYGVKNEAMKGLPSEPFFTQNNNNNNKIEVKATSI